MHDIRPQVPAADAAEDTMLQADTFPQQRKHTEQALSMIANMQRYGVARPLLQFASQNRAHHVPPCCTC